MRQKNQRNHMHSASSRFVWGTALALVAMASASAAELNLPDGAKLYGARCAACHDNPQDRTPGRDVLARNSPAFIMTAMNGVMAPMAAGLTEVEKQAIALHLGAKPAGGSKEIDPHAIWGPPSASMPLDGPKCKGKVPPIDLSTPDQWNGWGAGITNARFQSNPGLTAADVPRLKVKWVFNYPGSKNGQATIVGDRLFVTSMSGAVYALNAKSGCVYWRHDAAAATRSSVNVVQLPAGAPAKHAIFFSDWTKAAVALDAQTGKQLWKTTIDDQPGVQMTGSPTYHEGKLFVPISSGNEAFATNDQWECCKFRGALVALDAVSGKVLWKTYTAQKEPAPFRLNKIGKQMWGPAGGSIWSAPTIDPKRGLVYVSTSNSYTEVPHEGSDAVIAMEIETGKIRWINQVTKNDNYIIGCPKAANCPEKVGPDFSLGNSPILHTLQDGRQYIVVGQKSGAVYAMDPDNDGETIWMRRMSPGSELGGVEFGMAADSQNVYLGISDVITRKGGKPGVYALRIRDGADVWGFSAPRVPCRWKNMFCHPAVSQAVTAIPGAVFAGSMDGHFRAFATSDGKVLWDFNTAAESYTTVAGKPADGGVMDGAGPTIAGGMVYVHSGYAGRSTQNASDLRGREGNVLIAFSVDGK
ncbi:polyvinyl alcohol dehydrogenase (cytochrome) [Povalibacter uvarum]|uniref:Polyvinyl alcohol dehydrogenase (Cytochrome) n=1 Tax=Povalibacter uvarum TaxID=732238 RepID=A0A841HJT9_9GAMM|nr:PQQ-binding-like beta-propeller repeat protein [Povalibacter uvarum]MBB6093471.1 polyvinyl alcohol dehydrogenase (cytochrome) [Povalibacter uvarum]